MIFNAEQAECPFEKNGISGAPSFQQQGGDLPSKVDFIADRMMSLPQLTAQLLCRTIGQRVFLIPTGLRLSLSFCHHQFLIQLAPAAP